MLSKGERAPQFEAKSDSGEYIRSGDFVDKKNIVLFFYPGDFTPVCTKEVCSFRDAQAEFDKKEAVLLGISKDEIDKHKKFRQEYNLSFPLLTDSDGVIAKLFKIDRFFGLLPNKRVTFVIDKKGDILEVIHKEIDHNAHVDRALAALPDGE